MTESNVEQIKKYRDRQLGVLEQEKESNKNYRQWHNELEDFRNYILSKYIARQYGRWMYQSKNLILPSRDTVDHHVISYLAPLNFKRTGWGGDKITPSEQMSQLSDYFRQCGIRFIYVALPNKGNVYPEIICDDMEVLRGKTPNNPQWRKYLRETILSGVEVIDVLPTFMKFRHRLTLFTKGHNISNLGAKIVGDMIAKYLKDTTPGLEFNYKKIEENRCYNFRTGDYGDPGYDGALEVCVSHIINEGGKRIPYWNQGAEDSKIAILGDCNLQNFSAFGGGIAASLAYRLKYPVYNFGRKLIFGCSESLKEDDFQCLKKYKIIVYVAFASAPFVRSAAIFSWREHVASGYPWCQVDLRRID